MIANLGGKVDHVGFKICFLRAWWFKSAYWHYILYDKASTKVGGFVDSRLIKSLPQFSFPFIDAVFVPLHSLYPP